MGWVLIGLGFPSTLVGCLVLAVLAQGAVLTGADSLETWAWLSGILSWAVLSTCGAVQWFVVLPHLWRTTVKIIGKRHPRNGFQ